MNVVQQLCKRELYNRNVILYDTAIQRLKCYNHDEFYGITPSAAGTDINPEPPVFACQFCRKQNYHHLLALANEDGMIAIQNTNRKSNFTPLEGTQAHHNAIFDLAWMEHELKLVSVSGDHTAVLWDVGEAQYQKIRCFKGHTRSVKTVAFRPQDKAVFATGARDGVIMIWDTRSNQGPLWDRPDNFISNSHHAIGSGAAANSTQRGRKNKSGVMSRANSITGLVFQDQNLLISCGAGDGLIKVWDLRKNYSVYKKEPLPRYMLPYSGNTTRNGFTNLVLDPGGVKLYASCMDSVIYCYNVATYEQKPIATFTGHKNATFYVKSCLSPGGLYLASGSSDEQAYIWNTENPGKPIATLVGHGAEVTCVQWSPAGDIKLVTCSDDALHRLWRVGLEYESENEAQLKGWAEVVDRTPKKSGDGSTLSVSSVSEASSVESNVNRNSMDRMRNSNGECSRLGLGKSKRRLIDFMGVKGNEECYQNQKRLALSPVKEENYSFDSSSHEISGRVPTHNRKLHESSDETSEACKQYYISRSVLYSPTMNLPNYVIDGTSPHHQCSPTTKHKENVDWLTKLRKEKSKSAEKANTNSQLNITPKRRLVRSRSVESNKAVNTRRNSDSLLRFFRVAGKSSGESLHCSVSQNASASRVIEL